MLHQPAVLVEGDRGHASTGEDLTEAGTAGTPVIGLVPASVTTRWFTTHITDADARVRPVPGRVKFTGPFANGGSAPWGVALVEWPAAR